MADIETKKGRKYQPWEWRAAGALLVVSLYFFLRPSAPPIITEAEKALCRNALRATANIPQTVSFHATGYAVDKTDGILRMRNDFSAKNAYGLELQFDGLCAFNNGAVEVFVRPKAG